MNGLPLDRFVDAVLQLAFTAFLCGGVVGYVVSEFRRHSTKEGSDEAR